MALNSTAMIVAANTLRTTLAYAQLHLGLAGGSGTSNVTTAARLPITWAAATALGSFGLSAQLVFVGGTPAGTVYSVTLWDDITAGTFYGEIPLSGDVAFNGAGSYLVTVLDFTGTAT